MRSALVSVVVLAACGGSDAISIDDYPAAARDAHCRHLVACGEIETAEVCNKIKLDELPFQLTVSQRAAVAQSKMTFNRDAAASCVSALAGKSCDVTSKSGRTSPIACDQMLAGAQHIGETCAFDAECISQVCTIPACQDACCTGTCAGDSAPAQAKLGESCETAQCDADSFCDPALLMCVALLPAGAACAVPPECQYGLDCDPGGHCAALPALGQACVDVCRDEGALCSATTGTCVRGGLDGADCANQAGCSQVYRCYSNKCTAGVALGAPCSNGQRCADDRAYCDPADPQTPGTCALPRADGDPCRVNAACDSGYCDLAQQVCAPAPVCI